MALPASGAISFANINTELGSATSTIRSLNDTAVRTLFGIASGAIDMNTGHGKSNAPSSVTINLTITSNTKNYNIFANKGGTYSAGISIINLTVNSGIIIGSTSTATYALDTGTGWTTGDVINIINNGYICGKGGNGGKGSYLNAAANGVAGGPAFNCQWNCNITNASGYIYSGGGGGGCWAGTPSTGTGPGGGGAGNSVGLAIVGNGVYGTSAVNGGLVNGGKGYALPGYPNTGPGGLLGLNGKNGNQQDGAGGGGGGASGGRGGTAGHAAAGGGHGKAINLNGKTVTYISGSTRVYGGSS